MISTGYAILMILVIAFVTFMTRLLPFLIFPEGKRPPKIITYLSNVLPPAVMGMLVVFCLKDLSIPAYPHGLPELIAIALVVISFVWKKNTLLSIILGTISYMLLIQFVFVI